ncbi:MAG TPA: penicillin-binding transpeptidase domain-containing protein [Chloroflexota bacterium]
MCRRFAERRPLDPPTARAWPVLSIAGSGETAATMVGFMVEGVDNGYAAKAAIPGVKVGGKTGTAEVGDGTSHSWFIGFAPAEAPRVAIAVIMEHQGSGSDFATPAAQQVMRAALAATK